ncbi:MAG: hypothetical protein DMG38_22445 [Acidobacteria bacterium]|nr:MAG: hypothetical protein DMG38_22445 [Acidobacteriota bacterium]
MNRCASCFKKRRRRASTTTSNSSFGEATEDLHGAPGGGSRYPVQARMDGRDFARFHVDVGIGDEVLEPLDIVTGEDWLGFGGVAPPSFPVISAEQQFAEKLHAYTPPRGERMNTRTKDLHTLPVVSCVRHRSAEGPSEQSLVPPPQSEPIGCPRQATIVLIQHSCPWHKFPGDHGFCAIRPTLLCGSVVPRSFASRRRSKRRS